MATGRTHQAKVRPFETAVEIAFCFESRGPRNITHALYVTDGHQLSMPGLQGDNWRHPRYGGGITPPLKGIRKSPTAQLVRPGAAVVVK